MGSSPPAFPMALLEQAIRENGVGVCSFLGETPKVRDWVVTQFRKPAEEVRALRARFEDELRKFKAAEVKVRESCGGKRQGEAGLKEKERKLRDAATAHNKKAEGLLAQMRAPWGEARKRHFLKSPLPKMPASTLPPFGKWDMTGGGGEQLHGPVAAVHAGGVEIFDLAGTNASKSVGAELRAGGVRVGLHTGPPHCNKTNCMYIAVRVVLWYLEHPT